MKRMSQYFEKKSSKSSRLPKQVIYMLGLPGVGKTTVGTSMAKQTGFVLLDHNITYKEVCRFIKKGTYPAHLLNGRLHLAILKLLLESSIPGIICTMSIRSQPTSRTVLSAVRLIKSKGAKVSFIKLECDWSEHKRRIQMPSRRGLNKTNTIGKLRKYLSEPCFGGFKQHPALVINNTKIPAKKCAKMIISGLSTK